MATAIAESIPAAPLVRPKVAPPFPAWCKRTTVGLEIKKPKITFHEWLRVFEAADANEKGHQWHIGDALNEGENRWPEEYAQVLDPDEEERRTDEGQAKTYREYQQVSCRFIPARRRANLYFGHHHAVAYAMVDEEQDRWLDLAEGEKWSVGKLRKKIKRAGEGGDEDATPADLLVLQDPALRQLLGDFKAMVGTYDDKLTALIKERDLDGARFLHRYFRATITTADGQLDRDVNTDCKVVRRAIAAQLSPAMPAIEHEMRVRHYFMSTSDLKDRLDLMEGMGVIVGHRAEDQRHADARGDVVYEYKIARRASDDDDDIVW